MTITELADKIIKDSRAVLNVLLRIGNIDDFSIDTLDNIIITAHHIKEQAIKHAEDTDRTEQEQEEDEKDCQRGNEYLFL